MAHVGQKIALGAVGRFGGVLRLPEGHLGLFPFQDFFLQVHVDPLQLAGPFGDLFFEMIPVPLQLVLVALAFRDVPEHTLDPGLPAHLHHGERHLAGETGPVHLTVHPLESVAALADGHLDSRHRLVPGRLARGLEGRGDFPGAEPQEFLEGVHAVHLQGGQVGVAEPALFEHDHRVGGTLEERSVHALAFPERLLPAFDPLDHLVEGIDEHARLVVAFPGHPDGVVLLLAHPAGGGDQAQDGIGHDPLELRRQQVGHDTGAQCDEEPETGLVDEVLSDRAQVRTNEERTQTVAVDYEGLEVEQAGIPVADRNGGRGERGLMLRPVRPIIPRKEPALSVEEAGLDHGLVRSELVQGLERLIGRVEGDRGGEILGHHPGLHGRLLLDPVLELDLLVDDERDERRDQRHRAGDHDDAVQLLLNVEMAHPDHGWDPGLNSLATSSPMVAPDPKIVTR